MIVKRLLLGILLIGNMVAGRACAAPLDSCEFAREGLYETYLQCGKEQTEASRLSKRNTASPRAPAVQFFDLIRLHRFDQSMRCLNGVFPRNSPEYYACRGTCLAAFDKNRESLDCYKKLQKLVPANSDLCLTIGMLQASLQQFDNASRSIDEAKRLGVGDTPVLAEALGFIDLEKGDFEPALSYFKQELAIAPDRAVAHGYAARCLIQLHKVNQAIDHLNEAIRLDPRAFVYYALRGAALEHLNRYSDAIIDYERASNVAPTYLRIHEWQGDCYLSLGNWAKAMEQYSMASASKATPDICYQLRRTAPEGASLHPLFASNSRDANDLLLKIKRCSGRGDPQIFAGAEQACRLLPTQIRLKLRDYGVSIVIASSVQDFVRSRNIAKTEQQFVDLAGAGGIYLDSTKEVVVAETPASHKTKPAEFAALTLHELGHAYNACSGWPTSHLPFKLLCARDCAKLDHGQCNTYQWYLSQGRNAPNQLFADLFAAKYCGFSSFMVKKDCLKRDFPLMYKFVDAVSR